MEGGVQVWREGAGVKGGMQCGGRSANVEGGGAGVEGGGGHLQGTLKSLFTLLTLQVSGGSYCQELKSVDNDGV